MRENESRSDDTQQNARPTFPGPRSTWSSDAERTQQLTDIIDAGDDDNAECAAADLFQEFPNQEP